MQTRHRAMMEMLNPALILQSLMLLGVANGAPMMATKLLKDRFDAPLDAGLRLPDGRPLFGASKTIRGLVVSVTCTGLAGVLLGVGWPSGAAVAVGAMAGDLVSSFVKRRLGLDVHAQALGLDQIPEALLPMLLLRGRLGLSAADIAMTLLAFVILELVLSRVLFWLNVRDRPY